MENFIFFVSTAAVLLAYLCFVQFKLFGKKKKKQNYPPIVGTIFHQLINFKRLHDFQTELCCKYKTFRLFSPFNNLLYITEPANVEYILKTNFKNYGKGSFTYENVKDLLGDGIFAVDGEKWRHQRKLASYEFSTKVLRDFSSGVFKTKVAKLAQVISCRANSQEPFAIQDLLLKSTMDSIFKVGFGVELNTLEGSEDGTKFAKAFDNSSALIAHRYVDPFWKIKRFLNIGQEPELRNHVKVLDEFVYKLINNKIDSLAQDNDSGKKEDLLSRFISEMERDPKIMTRNYLRDIILNFLIAGKETTGGTLSWFMYMLCKYPLVQEKIAQEVKNAIEVDDDISFSQYANLITDEVINKMQYLHAALTETLRLYPPVPMESKVCFSNDTLPDGFNTRKGDIVFFMPYAMGRLESLWGEDAEHFRPERWLNENGSFQPVSPFKFTAFQAGPRICLGKEFAYIQMKIFAAVLLRFFMFKLRNEREVINYRTMLTLSIEDGLYVHALQR